MKAAPSPSGHPVLRHLWQFRKQALMTVYLLCMGFALGVIYIYATERPVQAAVPQAPEQIISMEKVLPIPFEEGHQHTEVVVRLPESQEVVPSFPRREDPVISGDFDRPPLWKANAVAPLGLMPGQAADFHRHRRPGPVERQHPAPDQHEAGPDPVVLLPYATELERQTALARDRGHELMLHLPMQPRGDAFPGPHALNSDLTEDELIRQIAWNLDRFDGYVGINNHMGSAFTEDSAGISRLLSEVQARGLLVLDSRTSGKSVLADLSARRDIPYTVRDVFLDNTQDVDYILGQLDKLEYYARRHGSAVAIGHPYDETIQALEIWLPKLREKGINLVPLSHIVEGKYRKTMIAQGGMDQAE